MLGLEPPVGTVSRTGQEKTRIQAFFLSENTFLSTEEFAFKKSRLYQHTLVKEISGRNHKFLKKTFTFLSDLPQKNVF